MADDVRPPERIEKSTGRTFIQLRDPRGQYAGVEPLDSPPDETAVEQATGSGGGANDGTGNEHSTTADSEGYPDRQVILAQLLEHIISQNGLPLLQQYIRACLQGIKTPSPNSSGTTRPPKSVRPIPPPPEPKLPDVPKNPKLDLRGKDLRQLDLTSLDLRDADLSDTIAQGIRLEGRHLEGAHLQRAHLERASLCGAHLDKVDLRNAHLDYADLRGAILKEVILEGAFLPHAQLQEAYLNSASLSGVDLRYARLNDINLTNADLREAELEYADLSGADLSRTKLQSANLSCADLIGAKGRPFDISGADLSMSNLTGADDIDKELLAKAKSLNYSTLPDGSIQMERANLRQTLARHFNKGELNIICFDMEIPYEGFSPNDNFVLELIAYCERYERITEFVRKCHTQRLDIVW
jgi:uncharacterized protein YjbI with pentapeptide repeats